MAATDMFICELLCFLQNNYGKIPKNELLSILHGFYDDDEVSQAKDMLCDWASKLDGTPRVKARKESSNRRRLECEDILGLVEFLDKKKTELPVFVAVKLHRVPKMTPSDVDTVNLAETVADLRHQVSVLATQLQQVTSVVSSINPMVCVGQTKCWRMLLRYLMVQRVSVQTGLMTLIQTNHWPVLLG